MEKWIQFDMHQALRLTTRQRDGSNIRSGVSVQYLDKLMFVFWALEWKDALSHRDLQHHTRQDVEMAPSRLDRWSNGILTRVIRWGGHPLGLWKVLQYYKYYTMQKACFHEFLTQTGSNMIRCFCISLFNIITNNSMFKSTYPALIE